MKTNFRYQGVHQYWDEVFGSSTNEPTSEDIKEHKKVYWRMYNNALKARRRKLLKYVTLSIDRSDFSELKRQAFALDESIYDLMKERIVNNNRPIIPKKLINRLHQSVFELLHAFDSFEPKMNSPQSALNQIRHQLTQLEDMVHHLRSLL